MTTPNGVRLFARTPEGTEVDVTEGVQALYDHCVSSMDWGSGFLSIEDAEGIIRIAQHCGFVMPEDAAAEFETYARHFTSDYTSNIICATCGETVVYRYQDHAWKHKDHDPGHKPILWR